MTGDNTEVVLGRRVFDVAYMNVTIRALAAPRYEISEDKKGDEPTR